MRWPAFQLLISCCIGPLMLWRMQSSLHLPPLIMLHFSLFRRRWRNQKQQACTAVLTTWQSVKRQHALKQGRESLHACIITAVPAHEALGQAIHLLFNPAPSLPSLMPPGLSLNSLVPPGPLFTSDCSSAPLFPSACPTVPLFIPA